MELLQAAMDVTLCRATTMAPDGATRMPLPIRAGRIGASLAARAYRFDLRDHLIFPGLINAHDHLHNNAVPPLLKGAPFPNSYAWMNAFQEHFAEPAVKAALDVPKTLRMRHGALKNLLAGTTCVAHHDPWHAAFDASDFPVALLRDFGWSYALGWPDYGPPVQQSFADTPKDQPCFIHLAEGTDATARAELAQLDQMGCLAANSVLVHGVGLREQDIDRVIATGAAVVWCAQSNHALLGQSLDPRRLYEAGRLALGTDSRLSGPRDLLDEMRAIAARGELGHTQLLALATTRAASILRLPLRGSLAPGSRADLVIVEDRGGEARSLVGIQRGNIRAVVRDGIPWIADTDFAEWFAISGMEPVAVTLDGRPKLMARSLADPALIDLEPGLELMAAGQVHERDVAVEAQCS